MRGNRKLVALVLCVAVVFVLLTTVLIWPGRVPDAQLDSLLSFLSTASVAFFGSNVASNGIGHWLNGRNRTADSPAKGPADPAEGA